MIDATAEERELLAPFPEQERGRVLALLRDPASGLRELLTNPSPDVRRCAWAVTLATPRQLGGIVRFMDAMIGEKRSARNALLN